MKTFLRLSFASLILVAIAPGAFCGEIYYEEKNAFYWAEMFEDRSPNHRLQAVDALAAIGADNHLVVPALLAGLEDDNADVRAAVVLALGRIGTKGGDKVVAALKTAAGEFDVTVRSAALRSLLCIDVGSKLVAGIEKSGGKIAYLEAGKPWIRIEGASSWGDAELACLKDLAPLKELSLTGAGDSGLQHLTGLKDLKNLQLSESKATSEGIEKLKKALPNAIVINIQPSYIEPLLPQ